MTTFGDVISAAIRYRDARREFEAHYRDIPSAFRGDAQREWSRRRVALRKLIKASEGALLGAAEQLDTV